MATNRSNPREPKRYGVGIDVGLRSVGLTAIEVDSKDTPVSILSAISHLHDGGVLDEKTAETRLAASGVARRNRRLLRRKARRLKALEVKLREWGFEPLEGWGYKDAGRSHTAWRARARLVTEKIADKKEMASHLATAIRHIARHRGWRNPYTSTKTLKTISPPSVFLVGETKTSNGKELNVPGFKDRVESATSIEFGDDVTPAELAVAALDHAEQIPLRPGKTPGGTVKALSFMQGKLHQSDNANEIHAYARMQDIDPELVDEIIDLVFTAESPRGSWVEKIARDPLKPDLPRAPIASDAFQNFRIAQQLANVRVKENEGHRVLTLDEKQAAFDYLVHISPKIEPTWSDVGEAIGLQRASLSGAAAQRTPGEERLSARPPVHMTNLRFETAPKSLRALQNWWRDASRPERDALIVRLVDGNSTEAKGGPANPGKTNSEHRAAENALNALDEQSLTDLGGIDLPAGRAKYSNETLRLLTSHLLSSADSLHSALQSEFDLPDDWRPPTDPIGLPVGHPTIDRVTKIVARWLDAAERQWGPPESVVVEHVRSAFVSASAAREYERKADRRYAAKLLQRDEVAKETSSDSARVRSTDVNRFEAIQRQNGVCTYCGAPISYGSCHMDHIVPRKGVGSTNTRSNLVAICEPCNTSKSNRIFSEWASSGERSGVSVEDAIERTHHWKRDDGLTVKAWSRLLREIRDRFAQTEADEPIDARSLESVAWMAKELRARIAGHFGEGETTVDVYRGAITAEARSASGITGKIPWAAGSKSKDRVDRRHHAVDAAVTALLNPSVAMTLSERMNLRASERIADKGASTWKTYEGATKTAQQKFARWKENMDLLANLLAEGFKSSTVVVKRDLRLRLRNGEVHDATIRKLLHRRLGDSFSVEEINAASTPALWTALTREPDFDIQHGLPANSNRVIRIHDRRVGPEDIVELFPRVGANIRVRDGYAQATSIHHARVYRWRKGGKERFGIVRVFAADLYRRRNEDLFSVELPKSSLSVRTAAKWAQETGLDEARYLGWVVAGDQLLVSTDEFITGDDHISKMMSVLGLPVRMPWTITGFYSSTQISLTPSLLSTEGFNEAFFEKNVEARKEKAAIEGIMERWRVSVDKLFRKGEVEVIRTDALGRRRNHSRAHLPVSWRVE